MAEQRARFAGFWIAAPRTLASPERYIRQWRPDRFHASYDIEVCAVIKQTTLKGDRWHGSIVPIDLLGARGQAARSRHICTALTRELAQVQVDLILLAEDWDLRLMPGEQARIAMAQWDQLQNQRRT